MMNSIYLEAGASRDRRPPYIVVAVHLEDQYLDGIEKVMSTLPISRRLHKIKKLPVKHYLQIIEVVRLINERTQPKAIQAYMAKVSSWDIYLKGESTASIECIRRIARCLDLRNGASLRTSYNIGQLDIPSLVYERGQGQLNNAMLIALALSKCIRSEYIND